MYATTHNRPRERHQPLRSLPPPSPASPLPPPRPPVPDVAPAASPPAQSSADEAAQLKAAAEEAQATAAELAQQLAAHEAARAEAERERDAAQAQLQAMAEAAAKAAAIEEEAREAADAEAVVKALRLAEATAAAVAAAEAAQAAAVKASEAALPPSVDGGGEGVVVSDPFADLPPLPPRPDLTPGSLVMRAIQSGAEAGEEWAAQFAAMLRQADQDAAAFLGELQQRETQFSTRLSAIRDEAMARIQAAKQAAQQAQVHAERLRTAMDASHLAYLAASQRLDDATRLRAQRGAARLAAETALAEATALVAERVARIEGLDRQRQRLNALSAAFAARDRARDEAASAHALAGALLALEAALQDGLPLHDPVQRMLAASKNDPFLAAVLAHMPDTAPPRHALLGELENSSRHASQLALLEPQAGVLSRLLAIAASSLRMSERIPDDSVLPSQGAGVEACLARASAFLRAGRLLDAAEELDGRMGTASEAVRLVLGPLAQMLRYRAAAEQAHEAARAFVATIVATRA